MPLNAQEFKKRSEDFFAATYLNSVGIIQNVALGILAAKLYVASPQPPEVILQAVASFFAIVIIASEYSWWVLLIRRTPSFLDYLIPYGLGIAEFGVMAKIDRLDGVWFWAAGWLAIVGALSILHNRGYARPELFAECPWLLPRVRRNLLTGTILVVAAVALMLGAWFLRAHIGNAGKIGIFAALYVIQSVMLLMTTLFVRGVREWFEQE